MSEEDGGGSSSKRGGSVRRRLGRILKKDTNRRSTYKHKQIPIDNDEHYMNVNTRLPQSTPTFQPVVYRHNDNDDNNSVVFDDNMTKASSCYFSKATAASSCYFSHDPCAAGSKLLAIMFSCGPLLS